MCECIRNFEKYPTNPEDKWNHFEAGGQKPSTKQREEIAVEKSGLIHVIADQCLSIIFILALTFS